MRGLLTLFHSQLRSSQKSQPLIHPQRPPNVLLSGHKYVCAPPIIMLNLLLFRHIVPKYSGLSLSFIEKLIASGGFAPGPGHKSKISWFSYVVWHSMAAHSPLCPPPQSCRPSYAYDPIILPHLSCHNIMWSAGPTLCQLISCIIFLGLLVKLNGFLLAQSAWF